MFRKEERITISLRDLEDLMSRGFYNASIQKKTLVIYLQEFKKNNYENIDEFENHIDNLMNEIYENIKIYAQRKDNQKITELEKRINYFFEKRIFDKIDEKSTTEIKNFLAKRLKKIIRNLRRERRNEKRLLKDKSPRGTLFKRTIMKQFVLYDGIKNAQKSVNLEIKEKELIEKINTLVENSDIEKNDDIINTFKDLTNSILEQFEAIHEIEKDVEIEEAEIINEINQIIRSTKNNEIKKRLENIISTIKSKIQNDFYIAKRIYNKSQLLEQNILKNFSTINIRNENEIPTIQEFEDSNTIIKIDNNKFVVVNHKFILTKHGLKGEQIGSKFNFDKPHELYSLLLETIKSRDLVTYDRIELTKKSKSYVGEDNLIKTKNTHKWGEIYTENIRGYNTNIIYTTKNIPKTKIINIILDRFNPKKGSENLYKNHVDFFDNPKLKIYSLITTFPGKYAPPPNANEFWNNHALLKTKKIFLKHIDDFRDKELLYNVLGIEDNRNIKEYSYENPTLVIKDGFMLIPSIPENELKDDYISTEFKNKLIFIHDISLTKLIQNKFKNMYKIAKSLEDFKTYKELKELINFIYFCCAVLSFHLKPYNVKELSYFEKTNKKDMISAMKNFDKEQVLHDTETLWKLLNDAVKEEYKVVNIENTFNYIKKIIDNDYKKYGDINIEEIKKGEFLGHILSEYVEHKINDKLNEACIENSDSIINAIFNLTKRNGILIPFDSDKKIKEYYRTTTKSVSVPDYIFISKNSIQPVDIKTTQGAAKGKFYQIEKEKFRSTIHYFIKYLEHINNDVFKDFIFDDKIMYSKIDDDKKVA